MCVVVFHVYAGKSYHVWLIKVLPTAGFVPAP